MFLPFSLILSKSSSKSMIENSSVISHWLGKFRWNDCLFVCLFQTDSWSQSMILWLSNINPSWLIMMFSLPFLQWYWIRIVVSINQPFISIIIIVIITNDPSITYWAFTNDNDCNLPIITKWWFELGFIQYW